MKLSMVKGLILYLFVFYLLSFLGFLAYSYFQFSASAFLPIFKKPAISGNALVLFLRYLPAAHFCAVLFASSVNPGYGGIRDEGVFKLIGRVILVLLVSTFLFTLLSETAYTSAMGNLTYLERKSELGRSLLDGAEDRNKKKSFGEAADLYKNYLSIDADNQEVKDKLSAALLENYQDESESAQREHGQAAVFSPTPGVNGVRASQLFDFAVNYFKNEDYYSALYYANLGLELDPGNPDLTAIKATAEERIGSIRASKEETRNAALYSMKKEGYQALFDFNNPVKAYYIYLELRREIPGDKDVERYFAKAETELTDRTFFSDEGDSLAGHLFYKNLLFVNNASEWSTEVVYAEKLFLTPDTAYFSGLEVIAWDASGRTTLHYRCPLGKLYGIRILLTSIHREDKSLISRPEYISGKPQTDDDFSVLPLNIDPSALWLMTAESSRPEHLSITALYRLMTEMPAYGYDKNTAETELLSRILNPFSFFTLSLIFLYLGLKGRISGKINPLLALLSIPVWFYALFNVNGAFSYFIRIAAVALLPVFSFWVIMVLGIAVHGAVMAVLLLISLRHV